MAYAGEEAIVGDYRDGHTIRSMCEKHGVPARTIYNVLIRHRVPRRRRAGAHRKPWTADELARLRELRQSGWTKEELADEFVVGHDRLNRALNELGLGKPLRRRDSKPRVLTKSGYAYVRVSIDDPMAAMRGSNSYVLEHRIVMARHLGRALSQQETVHHINGDRADNRIENLQLRSGRHGKHTAYQCVDCGSRNVAPTALL